MDSEEEAKEEEAKEEETKEFLNDCQMSPTLSTCANSSDYQVEEMQMQDSAPTLPLRDSRKVRKPRVPRSEPLKGNMRTFWLKQFRKYFTRRQQVEEVETSRVLNVFLDNKKRRPDDNQEKELFKDLIFFTAVKAWFETAGQSVLKRSKVREEWKPKHFAYFKELLDDYGDHHSSVESQNRDPRDHSSHESQNSDSSSYLLSFR